MYGTAEGAREASAGERALGARAVARVRAAPRTALSGVGLQAPVDEDEAQQGGLVGPAGAAHATPLRHRYEGCSTGSSRASSAGTSTGATDSSAADAGIWSPAWLASA